MPAFRSKKGSIDSTPHLMHSSQVGGASVSMKEILMTDKKQGGNMMQAYESLFPRGSVHRYANLEGVDSDSSTPSQERK